MVTEWRHGRWNWKWLYGLLSQCCPVLYLSVFYKNSLVLCMDSSAHLVSLNNRAMVGNALACFNRKCYQQASESGVNLAFVSVVQSRGSLPKKHKNMEHSWILLVVQIMLCVCVCGGFIYLLKNVFKMVHCAHMKGLFSEGCCVTHCNLVISSKWCSRSNH